MDSSNFKFIEAKTILSKLKQTDSWFGITYNMNLYRGCQHGCIYSDTRSECYGIGNISTISIKRNALELLSHELSSKRKNKGTIGTGSMNDPYMPIENRLRLTRQALQLIEKEKFPIHIITKSNLVTRDIDLLQEISKTYAAVSFTITTTDDWLAGKIEPNAPTSSSRFEALKQIADKGIYTGITLIPILPFILLDSCELNSAHTHGVVLIVGKKKKAFLSDKAFYLKFGYEICDSSNPFFELLVKRFNPNATMPRFKECAKNGMT